MPPPPAEASTNPARKTIKHKIIIEEADIVNSLPINKLLVFTEINDLPLFCFLDAAYLPVLKHYLYAVRMRRAFCEKARNDAFCKLSAALVSLKDYLYLCADSDVGSVLSVHFIHCLCFINFPPAINAIIIYHYFKNKVRHGNGAL